MSDADRKNAANHSRQRKAFDSDNLSLSREELVRELKVYADLYEFSPLGHFTLDADGKIRSVNSTGAGLIGRLRPELLGIPFEQVVAEPSRAEFSALLDDARTSRAKTACELTLISNSSDQLSVRIDVLCCKEGNEYRLSVLDISKRKRSEQALQRSEARYRSLFETAKDGIMIVEAESGAITEVNPFLVGMLGCGRDELLGKTVWELDFFARIVPSAADFKAMQQRESFHGDDLQLGTLWGRDIPVEVVSNSYIDQSKVVQFNIRDITIRKSAEEALLSSEEQCRTIVSNINEYVYSVRFEEGEITSIYHSPKCFDITGYAPEEYYRDPLLWFSMIHVEDRNLVVEFLNSIFAGVDQEPIRHRILHKDGSVRWILNNCSVQRQQRGDRLSITRLDGFILDITDIKRAEENIFFLAHHDPLTKLPNRSTLYERMEQVICAAQKSARNVALLFLDIDDFKQINDSMGHDVGDRLLQSVAKKLNDCTRSCDVVSRLGGDEFVVMLWDCGVAETTVVAEKIIGTGFQVMGSSVMVTPSIGISIYPEDGRDYLTLLKHADIAMYHAKKSGGNNFQFFTHKLNEMAHQRFMLEGELRRALDRNEFVLYYQPKVDLATGRFSGMEALIRWQHPVRGLMLPVSFIGIAEESGILTQISKWIIPTVCRQIQQWQQQGIQSVSAAVNLSASFFQHPDFEETIEDSLLQTGIAPECLELELTEATIMSDPQRVLGSMAAMKALGLQLSIDDFGTGYSSLSYLKKLPVDKLKIDQSFIHNIARDADNAAVVRAVISIGRSMQLRVIAEGVENASQLAWLQAEGSEEAQGYYFSRPLPVAKMTSLLKQRANFLHNPRGRMQLKML
ncbi:Diguanylate cyclase/phosphodiesterase with PAS/PAC sensor(s) [Citrifermentans bremense]|uniref:Diguanylate cyclase/phosphodiesterase with PAS/PAC sensor(S) n=1 Tax=Citrifermentans bremense TaxID=60035 RepID=A0A6S6LVM8_9BACT|nr:EAL domain-containing protein [Citrifermentans bremense]BCG45703.1 Diguanylate cyclase/phosphodiesterase with PAS/PAC sensor(s) [Citrifermentans bremense]